MIYDPSTAPEGIVTHKGILATLQSRLDMAPAFRRKLVHVPFDIDEPYWVDDPHFDLEYHVRHLALPKPGDWRQLCILVGRLISRSLDPSRPRWELNIIEGLDAIDGFPAGCFAILLKIHHSMVDGQAGVAIINALHELEPIAAPSNIPDNVWQPEPQPTQWQLTKRGLSHLITRPTHLTRVLARQIPDKFSSKKHEKRKLPLRVPNTPLNGRLTAPRVVDAKIFSLADIKKIRQLVPGSTVNDVVLSVVSGALHRYLKSKHALPGETLVSLVPISTRDASTAKSQTQGNEIAIQTVPLSTEIANPLDRFEAICQSMVETKSYVNAIGAEKLAELSTAVPGRVMGLLMHGLNSVSNLSGNTMISNTIVTNVPGVQVPLYMNGAKCIYQGGAGPLNARNGIIHLVGSYCGEITLNYTACRDLLPDPEFYTQCIVDSFDELMAETGHTRTATLLNPAPASKKKRRTRARSARK